ncbi:hypothetical protein ACKGJO_09275 [Gracilimonas sp. Q87]|uniref:hypothetical protein n=1 Tax=Gracilimonas sp. Q87 TaxID=3384766 RepID=UPI00398403B0
MNKLILLFISIAFLASCATTKTDPTSPGGFIYYNIDFKKYSDQGFQITIEKPYGDYKSIGLVSVELYPETKEISYSLYNSAVDGVIDSDGKSFRVWKRYEGSRAHYYATENVDAQEAIDEIFKVAKGWGADAIANFDINRSGEVVTVSGFAIDKED